jgi:hypothetical protein
MLLFKVCAELQRRETAPNWMYALRSAFCFAKMRCSALAKCSSADGFTRISLGKFSLRENFAYILTLCEKPR